MRKLLIATLMTLTLVHLYAQWSYSFTHYSSADGLAQNSVMSILEDHKGYMWFASWDGINKFDGYTFKSYKAGENNSVGLANNRIDYLYEDKYGFIWVQSYDSRAHRFNPDTETFEQVPADGKESQISVASIHTLPDGCVWLLTEQEGAIRVITDEETYQLKTIVYSLKSGLIPSMNVYQVYQDSLSYEWLLTDNGLAMLEHDSVSPVLYFADSQTGSNRLKQSFYCATETAHDICFGSGKGRIWLYNKQQKNFRLVEVNTASDIISINPFGEQDILIATREDGFFTYHLPSGQTVHYNRQNTPSLPGNKILSVYIDRKQEAWFDLADAKGVTHFNPFTRKVKQEIVFSEEAGAYRSQPKFFIHEDINNNLWVHPFDGGFSLYDRENDCLRPFFNEPGSSDWRFSNKLHAVMSDSQGNLWMCTHSKGLEKISFLPKRFTLIPPQPLSYESLTNNIRSLFEDSRGRMWMGSRDGKLRIYDVNRRFMGFLTDKGTISMDGPDFKGVAYDIMQDTRGRIWIATKGDGISCLTETNGHFQVTTYLSDPADLYSLSDNNVFSAHEDAQGRIWVATFGGGLNYIEEQADGSVRFINHLNHLKGYPIEECYRARFVTSDQKGNIWVGTTSGAVSFRGDFSDPGDIRFYQYKRVLDDKNSLSNNDVYWIESTSRDELYFATFGGGLNELLSLSDKGEAQFATYTTDNGLPSNLLFCLSEDREGYLWVSTENGICKFDPNRKSGEIYYDKYLDIRAGFNEGSTLRKSDGLICFGTSNGLVEFMPQYIVKSSYVPPITLNNLLIRNEDVRPGEQKILKRILDNTGQLELSHKDNILTIQYAALDMKAPENIQYAYRLENFDDEWTYVDKQRFATYTNLPKGRYVFQVKSTNSDGVWMDNTRSLDITILPSFWETPLAYFLYVLGILGIIFVAVYILFTIYRLKHEVSVEQQISDIKLRFFTNISHELRTPLTLIAGPVENVLKDTSLSDDTRNQLVLVERNTDRMLRLVNQILDFRKIQNRKMKMKVQRIELTPFIHTIMSNFDTLAREHEIDFLFEPEKKGLFLWADADKLEKIVFNLLSNAFKYTPVGKMIKVYIHENEQNILIGVQDQGIGISESKKESLFVRFENLVDKNLFNQASSGIGLSLVKELVELHKATISVDTKLGEGSSFILSFPKGKEHFGEEVEFIVEDYTLTTQPEQAASASPSTILPTADKEDEDYNSELMLLVEDNDELRFFLRSIFDSAFRIVEARNGQEGLEKALAYVPDIIISDVMMPEKDGIALTKELRDNLTTSHIPIILLTAKSAIEDKLEGLEYGANDYITKPFSSVYLKARVDNLMAQHKKLQELSRSSLTQVSERQIEQSLKEAEVSPNDRKFINKLMELMEANMDNGNLVVEDLVKELAVSRSVFFKKLKALTGLAPIEFIREIRIKRAAQLIETGEYSMTQISYMVGINDSRYFSKCFKQQFGMTPTDYKEQKIHQNRQIIHTDTKGNV
ncbi:signal transduction histidine kinase/DNA-binding response OmpR family regulator/ligand-binding sensor domain-containing protein [Parabacteroides sp. PF5-5]|uniref:two-component regulator propeller domain-containing protein n=1 Tax=unclassified Parabacteroides TaxID=2649774 RepID=UPI002473C03C|nr:MULTISPECIES: two-component regulator propeller domain-containing protein [unclassified Parabacteroides]MDH6314917.1 signal transduction histidine kinase/DNA-binding response OmpR family regulator/ligand-binding sensor domain-containing protein [Parabacteroides sp. PF5-13]MDH6325937.1 signal transduction histidine kinase/DNA-binding response OmpR family regulator/ligand-binding sensor domain-containing protein [Parabacteroides sp. PH5-41]MDH6333737.1 signal transduction histidine kinase/DNA-b